MMSFSTGKFAMGNVQRLKIGIVGGSLAGLFTAALLQRQGHDVEVFERSSADLAGRGAGLVAGRELFDIMRMLGCEHVAQLSVLATKQVTLDRSGAITFEGAVAISRFSWDVLYKAVRGKSSAASYVQSRAVAEVRDGDDQAGVRFASGETKTFDLVVGADGIGSRSRVSLNHSTFTPKYAGYVAWRSLLDEETLPSEFRDLKEAMVAYTQPGIQSIGYLVPGASGQTSPGTRRLNWGWYRPVGPTELPGLFTDSEGRTHDFSLPRERVPASSITRFHAHAEQLLPPQLAAIARSSSSPWIQGIFDYVPEVMAGRRVVLVGDAAFVVRPHTAAGTSKAAGDAMSLAEQLNKHASVKEALEAYEADRSPVGHYIADRCREIGTALGLATFR
jgi:2-polyprenyl-6-methoxyphenol hydroxylase-like FAD-dependent oxidoreductase